MGKTKIVQLSNEQRRELEEGRRTGKSHAFRERCQMILLKSEKRPSREIAHFLGCHKITVNEWVKRLLLYYVTNMNIISFVTQKGGSGKTTLALNFAVVAMANKKRVVILDMDIQGTARKWYERRTAEEPPLIEVTAADLEKAIAGAKTQNFDWVLIDTPGRDDAAQAAAIRVADFCVIPCRPSAADLEATPTTVETIKRLKKPYAFVLTQAPPRSFRVREAQTGLSYMGLVSPTPIVLRNAYQDAQSMGLGVIEYEPGGRATTDVTECWKWIVSRIKKVNYGKETTDS